MAHGHTPTTVRIWPPNDDSVTNYRESVMVGETSHPMCLLCGVGPRCNGIAQSADPEWGMWGPFECINCGARFIVARGWHN
jgi:hypothetical protein